MINTTTLSYLIPLHGNRVGHMVLLRACQIAERGSLGEVIVVVSSLRRASVVMVMVVTLTLTSETLGQRVTSLSAHLPAHGLSHIVAPVGRLYAGRRLRLSAQIVTGPDHTVGACGDKQTDTITSHVS